LRRRPVSLLCNKLDWRESAETRMWPDAVIIVAPTRDDLPRFGQIQESMLIQALVPESAVEAYMDPARVQGCKSTNG
jgi:hypothetical protein